MSQPSELIRASFNLVADKADEIIDRFYENLFSTAPQVRPLFPEDMSKQKSHLLAAVGLVVKHADNLEALRAPLTEMGARHVSYGAQGGHFPVVRDTMIKTLSEFAGDAWTKDIESAWRDALNQISAMMMSGAVEQRRAA